MNPIVLIPARMAATRLPGKPLADIQGRPMIAHVLDRAREAGIGPVAIAAGEPEIVAAARGADVTLISANSALNPPPGVREVRVGTALELAAAVQEDVAGVDAIVMAAAVADFRPAALRESKIKKQPGQEPDPLPLAVNPDILRGLVERRTGEFPLIIGFAAETGDESGSVLDHGRRKLTRKGCDLLVVNPVGAAGFETGFESDVNQATILGRDGSAIGVPLMSKTALAAAVWDAVAQRLPPRDDVLSRRRFVVPEDQERMT